MNPFFLSESCLQYSFGETIDEDILHQTLGAFRHLNDHSELNALGVTDIVPAYNKLAVHFCGSENRHAEIADAAERLIGQSNPAKPTDGTLHTLPVIYNGEDLERVAEQAQITAKDVIKKHSAPDYLVAMIGFQPHFPYLFGLDPALETPRLHSPRLRVPAGAVAIGGAQTGVYPTESPGGWNLIGRTDPDLLKPIRPGDRVRFTVQEGSS